MTHRSLLACIFAAFLLAPAGAHSGPTFESGPVRPVALSPSGERLFVANIPDGRLEVFDVSAGGLEPWASVAVGLEPVALAVRSEDEVWVVNHLSDSISIVRLDGTPRVTRTLLVGDEPRDLVFAGPGLDRAFVTTAHRGQNSPVDPALQVDAIGRADVWVFDATDLGDALGGEPLVVLTLFGDTPRALAASADGSRVYAAVFRSGNGSTVVTRNLICDGGATAEPCPIEGLPFMIEAPGGLPAPNVNVEGIEQPRSALIVRFSQESGNFEDEIGRSWDGVLPYRVADLDVFEIDAAADPPRERRAFSGIGTVLFNMALKPDDQTLWVTNTEAINHVRFEPTVRSAMHRARIAMIDPASGAVVHRALNKHIDYLDVPSPAGTADKSLATPLALEFTADGSTVYVAAFGSAKVGKLSTAALEDATFNPSPEDHFELPGGGPCGLALDEEGDRLFVLTRFDNAVVALDANDGSLLARRTLHDREPPAVRAGRPLLYDARATSSNGEASCSSCHVFGHDDALAWDLGNPAGTVTSALVRTAQNPEALTEMPFHPMKGPMTTQTLRGLAGQGAMHWRGDRIGADPFDEEAAFMTFNGAFSSLLGRSVPLTGDEMQRFADFTFELTTPPNPIRNLDNSLTPAQQAGRDEFFSDRCPGCHVINSDDGFFGTAGFFDGNSLDPEDLDAPQTRKVADLRGLYEKVGFYNVPSRTCTQPCFEGGGTIQECLELCFEQPQIRGFGSGFDGATAAIGEIGSGTTGEFEFLFASPSELAPIVGQQVTLTASSGLEVLSRADLLRERASLGECDLVAKAPFGGVERGWVFDERGFTSDLRGEASLSFDSLVARSAQAGFDLTLTCLPPGSGRRAIDRDEDGSLDGDERAAGTALDDGSEVALEAVRVRVRRNGLPAGDERWQVLGRFATGPDGFPALDETGAVVSVHEEDSLVASFDLAAGAGWSASDRRARFRSADLRAVLRRTGQGVAFKVERRGGPRFVLSGLPVELRLEVDGRRASRDFAFASKPGCRERDNGDVYCR